MATHKKLFISNIPYKCTQEEFTKLFSDGEGYVSAELVMRSGTIYSRGFGYVTVNTQSAYDALLKAIIKVHDRVIKISPFQEPKKSYSVHIKFIPYNMTESGLADILRRYGPIIRCQFDIDYQTGKHKGSAIADFEDIEAFKKIVGDRIIKVDENHTIEVSKRRVLPKQYFRTFHRGPLRVPFQMEHKKISIVPPTEKK